jgi:hypothetical protein
MIDFLLTNWIWIAFLVVMIAMHRRGGCGSHGHHGDGTHEQQKESDSQPQPTVRGVGRGS